MNAVTLAAESARVIKIHPAIMTAFIYTYRATAHLPCVYGKWGSNRYNEGLRCYDLLRSQILASVNPTRRLKEGLPGIIYPRLDSLRDDPRYEELVRRVGLK